MKESVFAEALKPFFDSIDPERTRQQFEPCRLRHLRTKPRTPAAGTLFPAMTCSSVALSHNPNGVVVHFNSIDHGPEIVLPESNFAVCDVLAHDPAKFLNRFR